MIFCLCTHCQRSLHVLHIMWYPTCVSIVNEQDLWLRCIPSRKNHHRMDHLTQIPFSKPTNLLSDSKQSHDSIWPCFHHHLIQQSSPPNPTLFSSIPAFQPNNGTNEGHHMASVQGIFIGIWCQHREGVESVYSDSCNGLNQAPSVNSHDCSCVPRSIWCSLLY